MLIRLNVDNIKKSCCEAVGLWGCEAVTGAVTGPGRWRTSSPVSPTSYVISVGHEGDQFES